MNYDKLPKSNEECISLLISRGLIIENEDRALKYLNNVGYFRLTGYMFHIQSKDGNHIFNKGTKFEDIINLYHFDKKIKTIISEYLERIEICFRAKLTNNYSQKFGFFWYHDINLFQDIEIYNLINKEIVDAYNEPKEPYLKSYKRKYTSEMIPPSNMALEILSLGKIARLYKGLKNVNGKIDIANEFNLPSSTITSWIIYLAHVRNICAHHSRLWNKKVTVDRPSFPTREKYKFKGEYFEDTNTTLYGIISIIHRLLISFNPTNKFIDKIENLIDEYNIECNLMGFPENWKQTANWKYK